MRNVILGMDTGGTFTDAVLIDKETRKIISKKKSETTKMDLSIGIANSIRMLEIDRKEVTIDTVCLSTTLATNSVVEENRSRIGLIAMSGDTLKNIQGVSVRCDIKGRVSITGEIQEDIDVKEISDAIAKMKGKIDALVITGYFSVRNPLHENKIKKMANEVLDVPIICAHELNMSLGMTERTATAILNAHLLPVIKDLIKKTRKTLEEEGIEADILVMRGDGTMMKEQQALDCPVETVLSGPAASVVGGASLLNVEDALFVDLGGTTTDIASMSGGKVSVTNEGATINGWKTKVKAANIYTYGLGGDSRLVLYKEKYSFGPKKAIPICFAEYNHPGILQEILDWCRKDNAVTPGYQPYEGMILSGEYKGNGSELSEMNKRVIKMLKKGPRSIKAMASEFSSSERFFAFKNLVEKGITRVVSITPTDLLHASGEFVMWNADASKQAIEIMRPADMTMEECITWLSETFTMQLVHAVAKSAYCYENGYDEFMDSPMFKNLLTCKGSAGIRCYIDKPIVAVGAPARAWLTRIEPYFESKVIAPDNHDVANAVGAANGIICESYEATIRFDVNKIVYNIFLPWEKAVIKEYEDARQYVLDQFHAKAEETRETLDMDDCNIEVCESLKNFESSTDPDLEGVYENVISLTISEKVKYFKR